MTHADSETASRENIFRAWSKTTTGIVVTLVAVQFLTGATLAFYYVPSVDHAHATVSFIDRVLTSGSWLRSLHHFGSQWLPMFAFLHVVRLFWFQSYKTCRSQWLASVLLLGLVMAAGATGYSLPWDARAFFSTRIAEGLVAGLPFAGHMARMWLLGGSEISTLTLSRFFALHVLITPFFIFAVLIWRAWVMKALRLPEFSRHAIAGGLIFLALALWAMKNPAPLGPSISEAGADYLPRPGAQFLWLYQTLKYVPGVFGSIVGLVLPGAALLLLASLPWLRLKFVRRVSAEPQRLVGFLVIGICAALVVVMSIAAFVSDRSDPRTREQLARQAAQEQIVRTQPFKPDRLVLADQTTAATGANAAPPVYTRWCANCHGSRGEGGRQGELKFPPLIGVAQKPRRTLNDIVSLLNDPQTYGLEPPMRSFATKLTDAEKREIAEWLLRLRQ